VKAIAKVQRRHQEIDRRSSILIRLYLKKAVYEQDAVRASNYYAYEVQQESEFSGINKES
jgi:hypothetical protein